MEDSSLTAYAPGPEESGSPGAARRGGEPDAHGPALSPRLEVALARLERALSGEPTSFEFFQAVRLLERLRPDRTPVGRFGDPAAEVVRFSVEPRIGFPASEIRELEIPEADAARMSVNFMGLTGPLGVLPHQYTLLAAERKRARDGALGDFLDLFHHRFLSLFYRAWVRHDVAAAYEKGEDCLRDHLLDLVGMGLPAERGLLPVPDDVLVYYAGLLAPQGRSAAALEQLIEDFFGVPVAVDQFVGGWFPVAPGDQCPVGEEVGASTQLGLGVVVGDAIWDQQMRARVRLGPLARSDFQRFLPTGAAYEPLRALLRFFSHDQFDWELQLVMARDDVPGCVLGADDAPLPLGWSTWVRTRDFPRDADDTVLKLH